MIAVGTRVLFKDLNGQGWPTDPHDGQRGTVTEQIRNAYTLRFSDGLEIWAELIEVSAL